MLLIAFVASKRTIAIRFARGLIYWAEQFLIRLDGGIQFKNAPRRVEPKRG
jgi:hypothetical protein